MQLVFFLTAGGLNITHHVWHVLGLVVGPNMYHHA